ncbi:MAG: bifunctional homocysteine S-methyltransferase/methylenetetrahydrofolate reductase [Chloroflexi bacterium]|nr:bifunctional homocysteine S-methyltransferase/methylenetetrahydrofolate reductase [Chloroflexota bacterium]
MKTMNKFRQCLEEGRIILSDGAMGTLLHQKGVKIDECFDLLNLTQPAMIAEIHREYIEAGSNMIQTNTFGANRYKLRRFSLEDKQVDINQAAVDLVRRVASASFKDIIIAGDVGPLGVRLAPFGKVQLPDARNAFREQIQFLAEAGVDVLIIETITDLYELKEAIFAAREVTPDLPVIASMTFTRDDITLLGDSPRKVALEVSKAGADVIGVNCSGGPNQILRILKQMRQAAPDKHFSAMPNAGYPENSGGRVMYFAGPDYFGEYAVKLRDAGADVLGGCCGTTPQHIAAMRTALDTHKIARKDLNSIQPTPIEMETEKYHPTRLAESLNNGEFVVAVEMDPPRGLSVNRLIAGASLLAEAGANVINVSDSPMARMRMSPWAVCSLIQRKAGIETLLHFPTRGRNLLRVQGDLLAAHMLDVRNVFIVMGDPTAIGDYPDAMDNYDLAPSGLIKLIHEGFNSGVDHAGMDIGQPTAFYVGCALNLNPQDLQREMKVLNRKIVCGADFIMTQAIYDIQHLTKFLANYEAAYGKLSIPMLVGVLPLASIRHAQFLQNELPGITIPQDIFDRMEQAGEKGASEGITLAVELAKQIKEYAQGIYLMPAFNRFDYAAQVIEQIKRDV